MRVAVERAVLASPLHFSLSCNSSSSSSSSTTHNTTVIALHTTTNKQQQQQHDQFYGSHGGLPSRRRGCGGEQAQGMCNAWSEPSQACPAFLPFHAATFHSIPFSANVSMVLRVYCSSMMPQVCPCSCFLSPPPPSHPPSLPKPGAQGPPRRSPPRQAQPGQGRQWPAGPNRQVERGHCRVRQTDGGDQEED